MLVLKDTPSHISIDSLGLYLCIYRMFVKFSLKPQAFIQALLSTAIFPQRFIFFTVYLVQWSYGVDPEWTLKRRSAVLCKIYFSWNFIVILEFYWQF